jgi:phosphatidylglycerophosphate synthase
MLDSTLRSIKDRLARPLAVSLARWAPPMALTALSLVAGVASGAAAAGGVVWASLVLWWLSRLADGLDGPVARARNESSELGGYLDILGDTVVYAAIPLGVAVGVDDRSVWIATAVLIATFYVNAVSWLFLAAVIEKRGAGAGTSSSGPTTIVMPAGLIEGTETIVLFSILLVFPDRAVLWCALMAALVTVTVLQRVRWAWLDLR